ncbi:MAG: hypothetical protein IJN99_01385 [Clostridia bacterium]|nr:hypothetical protein [Clostridia bacterium]
MNKESYVKTAVNKTKVFDRNEYMIEPQPIKYDKKVCVLKKADGIGIPTEKKIDTKEELFSRVEKLKEAYKPFLRNLAPGIPSYKKTIEITEFVLDGKEKIKLPYYGAPLGNATQVYETKFELEEISDKAVYICFKGADYIAEVFVNDIFVGMHEGFFSAFEFEITKAAKIGKNSLKVILKNDFIYVGNGPEGKKSKVRFEGDKLYSAHGLGYDDPEVGWHHSPPGMGIYDKVKVEVRNKLNITDLYVCPDVENNDAELWVEVENSEYVKKELTFDLSLYGRNFKETVFEHITYEPIIGTYKVVAEHGKNIYKISMALENPRIWELESPYLYQVNVLVSVNGQVNDSATTSFGMRTFIQDVNSSPKGMFYLNGKAIRLRGANTHGFEQQDVMRGDFEQLIEDILLAKVCNMNFWRITQRPVQSEVYEYCDMLGFMTQTDLPLFGLMRRTKFSEGVRQAEEMARHIRNHPCNIIVSYINEAYYNESETIDEECYDEMVDRPKMYKVHRHLNREEVEMFFVACDNGVKLNYPNCVIKHVDGDYDPPDLSGQNCMPDNHCYTLWYNSHAIPFNKLYKGYWQKVLPDWYYSCGEYGAEGMENVDIMRRLYPKEWLREPFNPKNISSAQAEQFHAAFFDTPDTMEGWVESTQRHQAYAVKMMTEAFRRDPRMASIAMFEFIDAWPAGWMKCVMDCERTPKPALFEYKNALEPIMISLRSDRFTYYEGETVSVEAYICNDTHITADKDYKVVFELYDDNGIIMQQETEVSFDENTCTYIGNAEFEAARVKDRKLFTLKAILVIDDEALTYNSFEIEVFEKREVAPKGDDIVIITDLEIGEHEIAGETVKVEGTSYDLDIFRLFVSRNTGHSAVAEFKEFDFSMWYDKEADMIMPIAPKKFTARGFVPILIGEGAYSDSMVVGVKEYQGKKYVISFLDIRVENPIAERFLNNLNML